MEYETYSETGAQEKTRTSTTVKGHRHLKPTRLPIPPPGHGRLCPYLGSGLVSTLRIGGEAWVVGTSVLGGMSRNGAGSETMGWR